MDRKRCNGKQVIMFDTALANFSSIIENQLETTFHDTEGAGAAGGLGFALLVLGAELVSGAELVADASHMQNAIKHADLVITGEGQSDEQTLYGKAPGYIADLAQSYHTPVLLLSGSLAGDQDKLRGNFHGCFSIIPHPVTIEECMENAEDFLYNQTKQVVHFVHKVWK